MDQPQASPELPLCPSCAQSTGGAPRPAAAPDVTRLPSAPAAGRDATAAEAKAEILVLHFLELCGLHLPAIFAFGGRSGVARASSMILMWLEYLGRGGRDHRGESGGQRVSV